MTRNLSTTQAITDLDYATKLTDRIKVEAASRQHERARKLEGRQRVKLKQAEVSALIAQAIELERIGDHLAQLALAR